MSKAKRDILNSLGLDYNTWKHVAIELQELYCSLFKWEGLPDTCDERYIEWSLMESNQVTFFKEEVINDYLALSSSMIGKPDVNGNPVNVLAVGRNGYRRRLCVGVGKEKGVVIFDNKARFSPIARIQTFAKRIWNMESTIGINIHQQKTPRIWKADNDTSYTIKTILNRVGTYVEDVVIDKDILDVDSLSCILEPAPFVADKIRIEKNALWSEVMTFFGIKSNTAEKKERVTPDEVETSNGQAQHKLMSRLRARQVSVDKINKLYDLNISVELNQEVLNQMVAMYSLENEQENVSRETIEEDDNIE